MTVAILREIRDEIRGTNDRLDQTRVELKAEIGTTNARLDDTNASLEQVNARLAAVEETLKDLAAQ